MGKYLKYGIGEIVLVVIGILIALSINNWNEERKERILATENYRNLLTSLQQDSIKIQRTLGLNEIGLNALRRIIPLEVNRALIELNEADLNQFLIELNYSNRSFISNSEIYGLLTANNGLDLIQSDKIKSLLINLYDYQYKAYADLDARIDIKSLEQLGSIIKEKMGQVVEYTPELSIVQNASSVLFEEHYAELAAESRDVFSMLSYNRNNLINMERAIGELLSLIRAEVNS